MSRRSIHGHSRRRKNRRKEQEMHECPESPMHYVDETGQPLRAGLNVSAGQATGAIPFVAQGINNLGLKGISGLGGGAAAASSAKVGGAVALAGQLVATGLDTITRHKEAKIYEEAYTDESVGAMDFTGQQFT